LCLNYVQGGSCLLDQRACLLGLRGNGTRNSDRECTRHGPFDVWRTKEDLILISDLEGPYEGVKDCFALRVSLPDAIKVAQKQAESLRARIVTTERRCAKCGERFWARGQLIGASPLGRGAGYFCASCLKLSSEAELDNCWQVIGKTEDAAHVDLSDWCG
jgi:hypothetical protein